MSDNVTIKPYNAGYIAQIIQPGDARSILHVNPPVNKIECTPQAAKDLAFEILEKVALFENQTGIKLLTRNRKLKPNEDQSDR